MNFPSKEYPSKELLSMMSHTYQLKKPFSYLPHRKSKKLCIYIIVLVLVTEIYSSSKNSSVSKYIVVLRNKKYPSKELLSVMSHTYQSKKLFSYLPHRKSKKLCIYIIVLVLFAEIYSLSKNSSLSKYIVVYSKLSKV